MSDLIERLEKAEVGSRELDAEIAQVLGLPPLYEDETDSGPIPVWSLYTTSIDAALTLVPEGWTPFEFHYHDSHWDASVYKFEDGRGTDVWATWGKTLALALCIAALKARSQS